MKLFGLGMMVALCTLFISSCGANVEYCLQDESCGPVIQVASHDGAFPANPYDPFWDGEGGPVPVKVELGPQMITNPKWPNPVQTGILDRFRCSF